MDYGSAIELGLRRDIEGLLRGDLSYSELVRKYGVHYSTVYRWKDKIAKKMDLNPSMRDSGNRENIVKKLDEIVHNPSEDFFVHGKSTLYGEDGEVKLTWIKESRNMQDLYKGASRAIEDLCTRLPLANKSYFDFSHVDSSYRDRMVFLPLADMHIGLSIDPDSVTHGVEWNLEIAERVFRESIAYLMNSTPSAESFVIADLGDLLHSPSNSNTTPKSGHPLDVDGRYEKAMLIIFEMMINLVNLALTKYPKVYFYSVKGNHNEYISTPLKLVLKHHYKNEPRVFVDSERSFANVCYHSFGRNLLMFSHGDLIKNHMVESVMVKDNLSRVSEFENFDAYFGHVHHERQEQRGIVNLRYIQNYIPNDRWANGSGYRSNKNPGYLKAFVYDKDQGVISTLSYNPKCTRN